MFRNLKIELRDIKSKLNKAKNYKTELKEDAMKTEINLRNEIHQLKCEVEKKTSENDKLMNKDTEQLKKSLITRMKNKTADVKQMIKKKVQK